MPRWKHCNDVNEPDGTGINWGTISVVISNTGSFNYVHLVHAYRQLEVMKRITFLCTTQLGFCQAKMFTRGSDSLDVLISILQNQLDARVFSHFPRCHDRTLIDMFFSCYWWSFMFHCEETLILVSSPCKQLSPEFGVDWQCPVFWSNVPSKRTLYNQVISYFTLCIAQIIFVCASLLTHVRERFL